MPDQKDTVKHNFKQDQVNNANSEFILINHLISRGFQSGSIGPGGPDGPGCPDGPGDPGGLGGPGGQGGQDYQPR